MRAPIVVSALLVLAVATPAGLLAQIQVRPLRVDPAQPSTTDAVVFSASHYSCPPFDDPLVEVETDRIAIRFETAGTCFAPAWWFQRIDVGRLPAGPYVAEATLDGFPLGKVAFSVAQPDQRLLLHGGQFWVTVEKSVPAGSPKVLSQAIQTTDRSGYFWFFNSANPEVFAKVLDGRAVNGHYWVFIASLTNVETTVTVLDVGDGHCLMLPVVPPACPTRIYNQAAGTNQNFLDTEAFDYTEVP